MSAMYASTHILGLTQLFRLWLCISL